MSATLWDRANYIPNDEIRRGLTQVTLDATSDGEGLLVPRKRNLFGGAKPVAFDVALLAFHGNQGEDGQLQGLFEMAGVPYTGMRTLASAAFMDKTVTKRLLSGQDIPQLDCVALHRPADGVMMSGASLAEVVGNAKLPACVKPCHLGSSIGVAKVDDMEQLREVLPSIFRLDPVAIVEPFVTNLVEYNVSVSRFGGEIRTSAIERPKRASELLDFKEKYMSGGGGKKGGTKAPARQVRACCRSPAISIPISPPNWKRISANGRRRLLRLWAVPARRALISSVTKRPARSG